MPKPNVDEVTLVATQELATAVNPNKDWYVGIANPSVGNKITNKGTIETLGTIVSEQIGSGALVPDRTYAIVDNAGTLDVYVNGVLDPTITITDDGGFPRILNDTYLDNKDWSLFRRGTEYMIKGSQWQNDVPGGGIRLTGIGDQFEDGQEYFEIFKPVISSVIVTPDAIGKFSNGVAIINATSVASPANDRKLILLQASTAPAITYTLRAAYPENVICCIQTGGGANKQSVVVAPVGQTLWAGGTISRMVLGQIDHATLIRIGTVWYIVDRGERWKRVGNVVYGGIPGADVISGNGQTLQIAEYPGVDDWLTTLNADLPGSVITVAAWNAGDNTKWARDATTIKVPKLAGWFGRFLDLGAGKDPDRTPTNRNIVGSPQANQNLAHTHNNVGFNALLAVTGQGTFMNVDPGPSPQPDLRAAFPMLSNGGTEARPENVGLPALIYI